MMRVSFRLRGFFRGAFDLLDHSHQVNKGFRVHLLHCPAALDLHGTFRGSELSRNLLVEHARDKHGDHLLLARSQQVEAPLKVRYFFLLFTSGTILLQCKTNSIEQILIAEWLGEEFDCPSLHGANTHWNIAVAGEKNYGDTNVSRCQLTLNIDATQSGQSDVQHEATGHACGFLAQEGIGRVKALNLQTHGTQEELEGRTYGRIIIDDKNNRSISHDALPPDSGRVK